MIGVGARVAPTTCTQTKMGFHAVTTATSVAVHTSKISVLRSSFILLAPFSIIFIYTKKKIVGIKRL
jgi:hypothetical protein